jgi:hypothetical protein
MRAIWALCACAACLAGAAVVNSAQFPVAVVVTAVMTMVLAWL